MAELEIIPVEESAEANLPLSAFVKRGNARDAGKDVPDLDSADKPAEDSAPEPPEPEIVAEAEPKIAASTGKPDQRTRAGKKLSIQQEIDADTARKYAAKNEADAEEARLATLRANTAAAQRQPNPPAIQPPPQQAQAEYKRFMEMPDAPKIDQFTDISEFQYAVNVFVADKRFDERMAATQQAHHIAQQQTKFTTRIQAEVGKDPTFQQKLDATPIDRRIIPYLHGHAQGDEIMVYLVHNPQIAQRLTTLNPIDQVGQIGEIVHELKVRADAASRGPARASSMSNAKPPIKPLGSSPAVSDDDDGSIDENLPLSAFVKKGNANDPRINPRLVARR